jgi:hypothetical protein
MLATSFRKKGESIVDDYSNLKKGDCNITIAYNQNLFKD